MLNSFVSGAEIRDAPINMTLAVMLHAFRHADERGGVSDPRWRSKENAFSELLHG